jgi:prepilin-type N-terminal cleavage/methylation domain-containing protein
VSRWRRQEGFTLIELSVSLGLFAVVIVSLSLMFDRALSAGSQVRFDQVGKTLSQEKLEELRALPFYVPWTDEARRVDLLDWYFPDDASVTVITPDTTGSYDAAANEWDFTTTETPLVVEGKDFLRATTVQFVSVQDDGTIQAQQPEAGYQSDVASADSPASQSVKVTVTVSWISQGQGRSVELDTIIHNIRRGVPSVEASGSVLAAQLSGLEFHDGLLPDDGVTAEILATVGEASTSFREVTGSESDASADPLDVIEREPVTGNLVQPEQPAAPNTGATASSVPNTVSGNLAADTVGLSPGTMSPLNDTGSVGAIAGWGSANPSADTQARVSTLHSQNPEGRAKVTLNGFEVNSREPGDGPLPPTLALRLGRVDGLVTQQSTTTDVQVDSSMALNTIPAAAPKPAIPAVAVWATRSLPINEDFKGVVTIAGLEVNVSASASATSADTAFDWRVVGLRVWDPEQPPTGPLDPLEGGYNGPFTFGFDSTCGGWEDDPTTAVVEDPISTGPTDPVRCGATRVNTSLAPGDNPVPGQIPCAYFEPGNCAPGEPSSLSIVAGVTVFDEQTDPAIGSSTASIAQKNILSITTQEVPGGEPPLMQLVPMLVGVGDASADASFITHEH